MAKLKMLCEVPKRLEVGFDSVPFYGIGSLFANMLLLENRPLPPLFVNKPIPFPKILDPFCGKLNRGFFCYYFFSPYLFYYFLALYYFVSLTSFAFS